MQSEPVSALPIKAATSGLKPEETVRQKVIKELLRLDWREDQLQWRPEWPVPKT